MAASSQYLLTMAVVLAALLALALCGYNYWDSEPRVDGLMNRFGLASAESRPETCVPDEETRERLRTLMNEALDEAIKTQIKNLFLTWMKDERDQPARAKVGAHQALRGYLGSRQSVVEWTPPICSG